jgi:hypothetical protein
LTEILLCRFDHLDDRCRIVSVHLHHLRRHSELRTPDLGGMALATAVTSIEPRSE